MPSKKRNRRTFSGPSHQSSRLYVSYKPVRSPKRNLFWERVDKTGECWLWQGPTSNGYGRFRRVMAHRFAYRHTVGEIPKGLVLHHVCGVKRCVRPDHLEVMTLQEHALVHNESSTIRCKRGHPREGNTRTAKDGKIACRVCDRERNQRNRASARSNAVMCP